MSYPYLDDNVSPYSSCSSSPSVPCVRSGSGLLISGSGVRISGGPFFNRL